MMLDFLSNQNPKSVNDLKKLTSKLKGPAQLEDHETLEGRAFVKLKPEAEEFFSQANNYINSSDQLYKK